MSYSDHAATPQSSFGTLTLAGVLDDLAARFIVNLPPDELESMDRVCFQIEQAYAPPYSTRPGIWTGRGGGATGTSGADPQHAGRGAGRGRPCVTPMERSHATNLRGPSIETDEVAVQPPLLRVMWGGTPNTARRRGNRDQRSMAP